MEAYPTESFFVKKLKDFVTKTFKHFNVASVQDSCPECEAKTNKQISYVYEGVAGYVRTEPAHHWMPFYRLHYPGAGEDHLYTVDPWERDQALRDFGYLDECIACYIQSEPDSDMTPLYRLYDQVDNDHFFTASGSERTQLLASSRYKDEGVAGYVGPSAADGLVPFYRAYEPEEGNHFYTTDLAEIAHKRSLRRDTFCILPWRHLEVRREGHLDFCCKFNSALADGRGVPLSISEHSLDEIWNCDEIRDVREKMVKGERVAGCDLCYEREDAGFISDRLRATEGWQRGWLNEERTTIDSFKKAAIRDGFRHISPEYVELRMGNLCNLACRMCYGDTSSRIAADPVHRKWLGVRATMNGDRWWTDPNVVAKIFQHPKRIRQLYLLGGEPLLIKQSGAILQSLVDQGVAGHIELEITTNGTIADVPWLPLINSFANPRIHFSIDAYGALNEYIRYPLKWNTLVNTIAHFKSVVPKAHLDTIAVLQAYNTLDIVKLFRFCDSIHVPLAYVCIIDHPYELRTSVIPPAARRLAAMRLRDYAVSDCSAQNRETVLSLAVGLESYGDSLDHDLLRKFVAFTEELDRSRSQSWREACPELWQFIMETGVAPYNLPD